MFNLKVCSRISLLLLDFSLILNFRDNFSHVSLSCDVPLQEPAKLFSSNGKVPLVSS